MLRVGLTGGLASGKSYVGDQLVLLGCFLIKADHLGHLTLLPGGEAYPAVVAEFGPDILNPDETIDRRKLAALVFNDVERLAKLNALVPPVRLRTQKLIEGFTATHPDGIVIVEAAILVETGAYRSYDRLIVAVCPEEEQVRRAMRRDGITREEALARLRRQLPLADKIKVAHYVIDTSGPKSNTAQQIRAVYESLRSINQ